MRSESAAASRFSAGASALGASAFAVLALALSVVFAPATRAASDTFFYGTVGYTVWKWSGHAWHNGGWATTYMSGDARPILTRSDNYSWYGPAGSDVVASFSSRYVSIGCGYNGSGLAYMICDRHY